MENQETLESRTAIGDTTNFVNNLIDQLFPNGVVPTSVVVGRILLASDHMLGVEQAAVGTCADFIDDVWLKVGIDSARDVFALA